MKLNQQFDAEYTILHQNDLKMYNNNKNYVQQKF